MLSSLVTILLKRFFVNMPSSDGCSTGTPSTRNPDPGMKGTTVMPERAGCMASC